ncbi:cellulose synthase/poly-beta-1,6-N-acetylglucosamine synthase-like glycosyltransferase [Arcticibacter tournemirensis]|nr:glycosyltransferase [Arcticibacter tournemirensis]TQM52136.1 cellulose synthase/poly-beta-1,6-N-acetylglucosamine synthase-like glycosyltransferase [Arcticibacter tournemirensis]
MTDYVFLFVFILLQAAFIIQLYFIVMMHGRLRSYKRTDPADSEHPQLPVSVIICARNEEKNLEENLSLVLEQDYPSFEVVVVNDCSSDDSDLVLRQLSQKYPHLKVVTIKEHDRFKHGKKFAVTLGIKAASNEHLLFTDADCRPASAEWINMMQQNFVKNTEIVLGYSPYFRGKGFLNAFIRFETFNTAINYLSFALAGHPYMGVGRNLSYTKSLFFKNKGFASHIHIPSGDDDLFVNQNSTRENTVIEIRPESQVWSWPKRTWSSYWKQKIRHMGAGKAYKKSDKVILSVQAASAGLFYLLLFVLIVLKAQWWMLLGIYLVRLLVQLIVYYPTAKKLNNKDLLWWFPALDLSYNFFIIVLSIISLFKKKVKWK